MSLTLGDYSGAILLPTVDSDHKRVTDKVTVTPPTLWLSALVCGDSGVSEVRAFQEFQL